MDDGRPVLRRLADRIGILPEYVDQSGSERRVTSDATRVALLRAMGFDAETEAGAEAALRVLDREAHSRLLDPTRVVSIGEAERLAVQLRTPSGAHGDVAWIVTLEEEQGDTIAVDGTGRADAGGTITIRLPARPPLGYHTLHARLRWDDGDAEATQRLIVVPDACWLPEEHGATRMHGLTVNLYTVRSDSNWGIGNTGDLRTLMTWAAGMGASFVGVSPLHALWSRGEEISPYSPVSRLYRNPLYLEIESIPELADSDRASALLALEDTRRELETLRASPHVQYARIKALQRPVLEELHRTFARLHRGSDSERGAAYAEFLEEEGEALLHFATFLALDEVLTREHGAPDWFRRWPEEYRSPDASGVVRFQDEHAELVDFHCWIQFELDRQLGEAARAARNAGMRLGLYEDLAIGTSGGGSDAWAYPKLLLPDVSVGAPPDLLGPQGQNWGLPPLDPRQLRKDGYRYWIQLLRGAFHNAGTLRIDHVLGLFRQFWIPAGKSAAEGAYVRFPTEELLGILALESQRHAAIVVGEDLGTVPPEVPPTLERWRVLSSRVLYFEHDDGRFRPAASYPRHALATANTHDMAPLSGWWTGRDLRLRAAAGYMDDRELRQQLQERSEMGRRLRELLAAEHLIPSADADIEDAELTGAVHAFLLSTPSMLVGISLDDVAGETEPVNMPGLRLDEFPSWTRRMRLTVEELASDPRVPVAMGLRHAART